MKKALPLLLTGLLAIILIDTVGSLASRYMNFNYGYFTPVSFALYIAIPFFIAKRADKRTTIISGGLLGLFDSTVGWALSTSLHANVGAKTEHVYSIAALIMVVIFMSLITAMFGLLGWWLSTKFSGNK
jgi:hypothetical protein